MCFVTYNGIVTLSSPPYFLLDAAMQLFEITVREDWEAVGQQRLRENTRVWRWMLVAVVISVIISVLAALAPALQPYRAYVQLVLVPFLPLILAFNVQAYYSGDTLRTAYRAWAVKLGGLLLLSVVAIALAQSQASTTSFPFPFWFLLALAVFTWGVVAWLYRRRTATLQRIGFVFDRWPADLVLGACIGAVFGFHVLITFGIVRAPDWGELAWVLCYLLGLRVLSEEVLLRGLGLHVLMNGMGLSLSQAIMRLASLSALVYASLLAGSLTPLASLLYLAYGVALSPALVVLRYRRRSLVPSFAANLVFSLFVAPLIL